MEFYKIKNGKIHVVSVFDDKELEPFESRYSCGQYFIDDDVRMSGITVENLVRNLGPECLCKKCFAKLTKHPSAFGPRFKKRTETLLPDELFEI